MLNYFELLEKADIKLESLAANPSSYNDASAVSNDNEKKVAVPEEQFKMKRLLQFQIDNEKTAIQNSITNASNLIKDLEANSVGLSQGQSFSRSFQSISLRIDTRLQQMVEQMVLMCDVTEGEKLSNSIVEFTSTQRARIDSLELTIAQKTREAFSSSSRQSSSHTYLKKQDPPVFKGDIIDYPEFKRRWATQVHNENLPQESELDRLRDNIPESAKKMLVGEKLLHNA